MEEAHLPDIPVHLMNFPDVLVRLEEVVTVEEQQLKQAG
jgi:hypothetical protein